MVIGGPRSAFYERPFRDLLGWCQQLAVHLETRDQYGDPLYAEWKAGHPVHTHQAYRDWQELIRAAVARGVNVRRVRIVSEPLSDYVRFEHEVTSGLNIAAGEQVRWLARRRTSGLLVPVNDFWVFDDRLVRFDHFDGNGERTGSELTEDPALVRLCAEAFRQAWSRAVGHPDYKPALLWRP